MPKVSEMIQSKFLRKEDIDDELLVTVKVVELEEMPGDGDERRWVIYFKELPKGLVLNVTVIRTLESAFGADSDDWIGRKVTIYVDHGVSFKGKVVGGLRLRPHKFKTKPQVVPEPESLNDEIPR